jgi:lactate racemase
MSIIGIGNTDTFLTEDQIEAVVAQGLESLNLTGQRVLVIIPDSTRTMPLPLFFRLLTRYLLGKAQKLDFMVALGTHPPMSETALLQLVGISTEEKAGRYAEVELINHAWKDPQALTVLGSIPSSEIQELSSGLLEMEVPVRLNKRLLDYDQVLICGPVFPH